MDDIKPSTLIRFLLLKSPLLAKSALLHSFWLSPTSSKWDLRTDLTVRLLREILYPQQPVSISRFQAPSLKDPGIKGRMWIAKITLPIPEDDVRNILIKAIEDLKEGGEQYTLSDLVPVEAEWTGHRANVDAHRPRPDLTEAQHYQRLMSEVSSHVTILYLHGGAHFLCDPATHRIPVSRLAGLTRGRCLSVRYRLSPKHAFPAALLDAFVAYLSLLSPPPNSFHDAVPASHIVIAGDSSGGGLALSLLQLLLHLQGSTIKFYNHSTPILLPAGVAIHSGWTDLTRSMPSIRDNAAYDYLPPPFTRDYMIRIPPCDIWPADPLRGDLYCDTSMMCHPLVSPVASQTWRGSCPLWLCYGQEMLVDEGKAIAKTAATQGVSVVWEEWEAMPHCFAQLLGWLPVSKRCFAQMGEFCERAVEARNEIGKRIESKGTWYAVKSGKQREVDVKNLEVCGHEEMMRRMKIARDERAGMDGSEVYVPPKL